MKYESCELTLSYYYLCTSLAYLLLYETFKCIYEFEMYAQFKYALRMGNLKLRYRMYVHYVHYTHTEPLCVCIYTVFICCPHRFVCTHFLKIFISTNWQFEVCPFVISFSIAHSYFIHTEYLFKRVWCANKSFVCKILGKMYLYIMYNVHEECGCIFSIDK